MTDASASKPFGQAATPITTKERLDALKAARPKPKPERHLTPSGTVETETKRSVNSALEARIAAMSTRLDRARQSLQEGRAKALARGKARAGFGRSS
ncbi:MAG: hypothetical protein ACE360_00540 [Hyphomicrobiales bacterium]